MILLLFVDCSVFLVLLLCCYGFMALLFELLFFNIFPPPSDMAMAEALLGANDFWWGYAVPFSAGLGLVPWLDPIPIPGHQGTHWPWDRPQVYGICILTGQVEGPFPKKDWELGRALLPLLAVICCMSWLPLSDSFFSNTLDASAPHGGHHHVHLAKSSSKPGQGQYYPWWTIVPQSYFLVKHD